MASLGGDAELAAFTNAVVDEENRNPSFSETTFSSALTSKATGVSNFGNGSCIALQNVYYSSKKDGRQVYESSTHIEIPERSQLFGKGIMTSRKATLGGMCLNKYSPEKQLAHGWQEGFLKVSDGLESHGPSLWGIHYPSEASYVGQPVETSQPFLHAVHNDTSMNSVLQRKWPSFEIMQAQANSDGRNTDTSGIDDANNSCFGNNNQSQLSANYLAYGPQSTTSRIWKKWTPSQQAGKRRTPTFCLDQESRTTKHPRILNHNPTGVSSCDQSLKNNSENYSDVFPSDINWRHGNGLLSHPWYISRPGPTKTASVVQRNGMVSSLLDKFDPEFQELNFTLLKSAHSKSPRCLPSHPNFENQIGDTSLRGNVDGFAEKFPDVNSSNTLAKQFDAHSPFIFHQERRECFPLSRESSNDCFQHPVHQLLQRETTSEGVRALSSLESNFDPDFEEKRFTQESLTLLDPDTENKVDGSFLHKSVNRFDQNKPIVIDSFNGNININGPQPYPSQHVVSHKRSGRKTSIHSDESSNKRPLIASKDNTSKLQEKVDGKPVLRNVDSSTQTEPVDNANQNSNQRDQEIPINMGDNVFDLKSETLSTKKVPTSLFIDTSTSVPRDHLIDCSSVTCCSPKVSVSSVIEEKHDLRPKNCNYSAPHWLSAKADDEFKTGRGQKMKKKSFENADGASESAPTALSLKKDTASTTVVTGVSICTNKESPLPSEPKSYKCAFNGCEKGFHKKSHLTSHQTLHTGEKPFVCPWKGCEKEFRRSDERKRHYRRHTGERPYHCQRCDKRFSRSDHLRTHVRAVHNCA